VAELFATSECQDASEDEVTVDAQTSPLSSTSSHAGTGPDTVVPLIQNYLDTYVR
jgi:hypothetical protein